MNHNFYNPRQYSGPIAKRPKMITGGPRGPNILAGSQMLGEDDGKRMMSFKEFMLSQSNEIDEQQALQKYSQYKAEFTKKRIDKFFKEHQEEEWFRNKYRPIELKKQAEALKESKDKRKRVYNQMDENKLLDDIRVDFDSKQQLSSFLDNFSLLLEGATVEDLNGPAAKEQFALSSIFLPNLHPSIDKSMIEEFASTHKGFLRVALSEAQPNNGFRRRAWVTYKSMSNDSMQKLIWEFNVHKFNGQETKALINKEGINIRLRYANYWFNHADCVRADLKNVAKLLVHFEGEEPSLLSSIKDYLIEEVNEDEKILGVGEQGEKKFSFEINEDLLKVLDKAILYLRVVHSFDYYAATEYTGEDDMPQKIGVMYTRTNQPPAVANNDSNEILRDFIEAHKSRIESYLDKPTLSDLEQQQLGRKSADEEIENFIYQNTFEKEPGAKYLCKLTKKKFTSPEYVRKHILSRCTDKIDEVRAEVEFFNNYIADPKRPV